MRGQELDFIIAELVALGLNRPISEAQLPTWYHPCLSIFPSFRYPIDILRFADLNPSWLRPFVLLCVSLSAGNSRVVDRKVFVYEMSSNCRVIFLSTTDLSCLDDYLLYGPDVLTNLPQARSYYAILSWISDLDQVRNFTSNLSPRVYIG